MDYKDFTRDQLIARIHELEAELLEAKHGYIYVVQFENDKQEGIYKAGKTGDNIETRFSNYRSVEGKELGELHVIRVAAVSDKLAAEQYMHDLIRKAGVQSNNDSKRNKKSTTKNEWYIDNGMERIEQAFNKTLAKFGIDDDDMVRKYDRYARDALEAELVAITHYKTHTLQRDRYFFHPSTSTVYKQTTYGKVVMSAQKSGKYGMTKDGDGTCSVSLGYIKSEYA